MQAASVLPYLAPLLVLPPLALWLRHYMRNVETERIEAVELEVLDPDLPSELDGMRICQISDLHVDARGRNELAVARAVRGVTADLYVFSGDMIFLQGGVAAFFRWLDALGDCARPAIAVLGNAEHKSYVRTEDVLAGFAARGVPVLMNDCASVEYRGGRLQVVGVDDPHTRHHDFARAYAHADPGAWTLLLCHSPDGLADLGGHRADLALAGHTHGGQIRLPLIGAVSSNTRRVRGLVGGWYEGADLAGRVGCQTGARRLYVSRGLGTGGFRGRLLCPPELPVFTLRQAATGGAGPAV